MQLTLQDIPADLDQAIRSRARAENKSIEQVVIEILRQEFGLGVEPTRKRDLSFMLGTWVEDPEFDRVLEEQRRIDPELWR